jgi:manganese oxidase
MFVEKLSGCMHSRMIGLIVAIALLGVPLASAENSSQTGPPSLQRMSHQLPGWAEKLKGQTIVEDTIGDRPNRSAMIEQQHQRIMEHMAHDPQIQDINTGMFNTSSMMHQYGAGGQGMLLVSDPRAEPAETSGGKCPATAPVKQYNISAISVEITFNQWLDFYPGYMYVLDENLDKVRAEEAKNKEARDKEGFDPGAVVPGIQAQWIQPLVFSGNQGDCIKIKLSNKVEEGAGPVSLHIHGSSMVVSATGAPATTTNPDAIVEEKKTAEFKWYIHPNTQEGVRQFHTYTQDRELTVMGLFGAFVVEPRGSAYLEPLGTGDPTPASSGWQMIIKNGTGPDFREFVLIYHEVGDEAFRPLNKKGDFLPQRDPLTDAYRLGGRAINYRSEPFGINNMLVQHEYFGFEDESMGYSSYTFGDPSPTIARSYIGDPAKFRLVHGGSEVFHSHHAHGGAFVGRAARGRSTI